MEYRTAKREDMADILELYKQLNQSNDNFSIGDADRVWDKIEKGNINILWPRTMAA
jgi:hypothetical protein